MTIISPYTTERLASDARNGIADHDRGCNDPKCSFRDTIGQIAAALSTALPDLTPAALGEAAMHTAAAVHQAYNAILTERRHPHAAHLLAVNFTGAAGLGLYETPAADRPREAAWHTIRRYLGTDPFTDEPVTLIDVTHADECHTLPPWAMCWYKHEPHRSWWPAGFGQWRIRPAEYPAGGDEDGPFEPVLTLDIQTQDATGEWADWAGPTVGELEAANAEPAPNFGALIQTGQARAIAEYWNNAAEQHYADDPYGTWTTVGHVASCILAAMNTSAKADS